MAKGGQTVTQKQEIDPALKPYRDAYLRQAFGYASGQPLRFYGMPGYEQGSQLPGGAVPGGAGMGGPAGAPRSRGGAPGGAPGGNLGFGGAPAPFQAPPDFGPGADPWVAAPNQAYTDMFMNPYEKNVIQGVQADFDRQRDVLGNQVDDLATKANAFGGSRHAVLQAEGMRGLGQEEAEMLARLRYGGYDTALTRGMMLGQSERDAARSRFDTAQNFGLGQLGIMQGALTGVPQGMSMTSPNYRSPVQGMAGGALAGAPFGPWGIGIGAGLGLLGGM